jgi:HSP20 family protein
MSHQEENHKLPSLRAEVETLFSRVLGHVRVVERRSGRWLPSLDLIEEPGAYVIEMDMPGVRHQDLTISVAGRRLTLSGRREVIRERSGPRVHVHERWFGTFSRSIELPGPVDDERITTTMREGILSITLPKRRDNR